MDQDGIAVARKTRSARKGKLTIALTELCNELKEEEVVPEQIRQLLDKTKTRLDALEDAHDKLLETINEEEYPKEEEWFGLVVKDYNQIARRARQALSQVGKPQTKISEILTPSKNIDDNVVGTNESDNQPVSNDDDHVNVSDDSVNANESDKSDCKKSDELDVNVSVNKLDKDACKQSQEGSLLGMVQAMTLPAAQMKKFSGDPLSYHSFVTTFNNSVSCIPNPSVKLNVLRSLCSGRALEATDHCVLKPPAEGLAAALAVLKKRYGNNAAIVQAWVKKILNRPKVEMSNLQAYADDLDNCREALDALNCIGELNNQGSLKSIVDKLPKFLQHRWTREVYKLRENDKSPTLSEATRFIRIAAIEANDPVYGTAEQPSSSYHQKTPHTAKRGNNRILVANGQVRKKCWNCDEDHWPDQCPLFLSLTPTERVKRARENHVCYSCLKIAGKTHKMSTCSRKKKCPHCQENHHKLLHGYQTNETNQLRQEQALVCHSEQSLLPVISARIGGKIRNVVLDSCASITLIREELAKKCGFESRPIDVEIGTLGGEVKLHKSRAYKVMIQAINGHTHTVLAVGVPVITQVPEIEFALKKRLQGVLGQPLNRGGGDIDLLIGVNEAFMHTGETRELSGYIARKSPLGWVVFGSDTGSSTIDGKVMLLQLAQPIDLSKFWKTEEMGVRPFNCECKETEYNLNPNDRREFREMWDACISDGESWVMPYPWSKPPDSLPNNKKQCAAKLLSLERRLNKNEDLVERYNKAVCDLVERGFARILSNEEELSYMGPVHYIPHHPIIRSESKSTPIRVVFNSSSKFGMNECLNDFWKKGPDLLQNIVGVILRFREFEVGVVGDISKMFYRVKIPLSDQHVHRFLWRNCSDKPMDTYVLTTVTPGDKPAPPMAIIALLKTADAYESIFPTAAKILKRDTYMDDICTSTQTANEADDIIKELDQTLSHGGFRVKEWTTNSTQRVEEAVPMLSESDDQKVLGVVWETGSDVLKYKVKPLAFDNNTPLTKRRILSELSRVFDPIGFAGAFLIRGKIKMQSLWSGGLGWDEELSKTEAEEWKTFFRELEYLDGISFPRCLIPSVRIKRTQLITFCDASEQAFGAVCYVRLLLEGDGVVVRFVAAKSRVAPLKKMTVPRLELQAAVIGARLASTAKQEMTTTIDDQIFLSDSEIALCWIRGQSRQWKSFVSNRVSEIQCNSDPSDWYHIPGEHNVADRISRGIPVQELTGVWREGPEYLHLPQASWPKSILRAEPTEVDIERSKEKKLLLVQEMQPLIDVKRFSSWRKLLRVTAYVFRFIMNAKAKCCIHKGPLSVREISDAERYWIIEAQKLLKGLEEYRHLSPFKRNNIVYVGGRASTERLSYDTKHPVLLPQGHHISYLITKHVHDTGHYGVATTAAKVSQQFWIIGVTRLAKTIKYRCFQCRSFERKTEQQYMADLPKERNMPFTPPFHCTAVDYFGPYEVKISRKTMTKHYGVIFTCMNTRAVHLELAGNCSTEEFLQVLRRFFAIRGKPAYLQSDNGTQFVSADKELRSMIQGWDKEKLQEYCAGHQTTWRFITPLSPHHNGCVEALVKSCKNALRKAVGSQRMKPFELYTYLQEAANLVNQRPIGRVPNDPDDGSYLCPNDILLGRSSSRVPQGPFKETKDPRNRFAFVQRIVEAFWKIWSRDVFPHLVPRKKWHVDRRNVKINDIVLLSEPTLVRGHWKLGKIIDVYPGTDGKVRSVKVKTAHGLYQRPITKIVVLHPVEGFDAE